MSLKAPLKRVVQGTFEGLWSAGFRVLGHLRHDSPAIWSSPGGRRILVVAPHPDDEVAGCGGAILAHRRCGDRVRVVVATDGRRSRALGFAPERMAATRRAEMEESASCLDVELDWIGVPEGEWQPRDLEDRLARVLRQYRPDAVYAPSRIDFHPEHLKVARALARSLVLCMRGANVLDTDSGSRSRPELRIYAIQVPLTPMLSNVIVPVDTSEPRLAGAFAAHHSQLGSLEPSLRHRRYLGRLYGLGGAEELWRLSAGQYHRLHRDPPRRSPGRTFRGLRYYAWSDPLAYLRGLAERRRLARWAS